MATRVSQRIQLAERADRSRQAPTRYTASSFVDQKRKTIKNKNTNTASKNTSNSSQQLHRVTYREILKAVSDMKVYRSSKGVSRVAIKSRLRSANPRTINVALKNLVNSGKLVQVNQSFKFPTRYTTYQPYGTKN